MEYLGKALKLYATDDLTREQWLERRKGCYVGASETAAILGLGDPRWSSPINVYQKQIDGHDAKETSLPASIGIAMESRVLEHAEKRIGSKVHRAPWVLRHPSIECLAVNLDGYLETDSGEVIPVEAKTATRDLSQPWVNDPTPAWNALSEWVADDGKPFPAATSVEGYFVQLQCQIAVVGSSHGFLAVALGAYALLKMCLDLPLTSGEFRVIRVPRDDAMVSAIEETVPAFWTAHVETKIPPEPLTHHDLDAIKKVWRESLAGEAVERQDLDGLISKLDKERAAAKRSTQRAKAMEARIRHELEDKERLTSDRWIVTAKNTKSGSRPVRIKRNKNGAAS